MIITRYKKPVYPSLHARGFDLLNEFLNKFDQKGEGSIASFNPLVNTREENDRYYIEVDLPGIKKEDVEINVDNNILSISGKRGFKNETKEENYYRIESTYGTFERSFRLPEKVDVENIKASSVDGVLEVMIPKLPASVNNLKKIEIQ